MVLQLTFESATKTSRLLLLLCQSDQVIHSQAGRVPQLIDVFYSYRGFLAEIVSICASTRYCNKCVLGNFLRTFIFTNKDVQFIYSVTFYFKKFPVSVKECPKYYIITSYIQIWVRLTSGYDMAKGDTCNFRNCFFKYISTTKEGVFK